MTPEDIIRFRYEKHAKDAQEWMGTFLKELRLSGYDVQFPKADWRYENFLTIRDKGLFIGVAAKEDYYQFRWTRSTSGQPLQILLCEDIEEVRERIGQVVRDEL